MPDYSDHPIAELFPLMSETELMNLVEDIKENGLLAPITLLDDMVLDGRNRKKACELAHVEPRFRVFGGEDPVHFVMSVNFHRRHMTISQKAMVAARAANLPHGDVERLHKTSEISKVAPVPLGEISAKTVVAAAVEAGVSPRLVKSAKRIIRDAPKQTVDAVTHGEKTIHAAVKEIKQEKKARAIHKDKTGYEIPDAVWEDWQRAEEFAETLRSLSKIKVAVDDALEEKDIIFAEITNATIATLQNAYGDLKRVLPYAVCTSCAGHQRAKCTFCKGRGWLSQFLYSSAVPSEIRKMREMSK